MYGSRVSCVSYLTRVFTNGKGVVCKITVLPLEVKNKFINQNISITKADLCKVTINEQCMVIVNGHYKVVEDVSIYLYLYPLRCYCK